MTSSSKRELKPGKSTNDAERDSASPEIQDVVKRVEVRAQEFKTAIRRTVEEAWELGDALLPAKELIAHGHWAPWLQSIGLNARLAQRCMALRRGYAEKRRVSDLGSINAALRMLPAGPTIDAEFKVEEVGGRPKDGSQPKPSALSAGSDAADPSTSRNEDAISKSFTDGAPAEITERPHGSDSGMPHLPGIEAPPSPTAATHSSMDTDPRDENGDIRSFVEGFDGFVTRLDTVLGPEPAIVAQRLGPHLGSLSRTLRALASTIAGYLEASADKEAAGEDMPEDLVPTLQRLLKAVPERGRSVRSSPHAGRDSQS